MCFVLLMGMCGNYDSVLTSARLVLVRFGFFERIV